MRSPAHFGDDCGTEIDEFFRIRKAYKFMLCVLAVGIGLQQQSVLIGDKIHALQLFVGGKFDFLLISRFERRRQFLRRKPCGKFIPHRFAEFTDLARFVERELARLFIEVLPLYNAQCTAYNLAVTLFKVLVFDAVFYKHVAHGRADIFDSVAASVALDKIVSHEKCLLQVRIIDKVRPLVSATVVIGIRGTVAVAQMLYDKVTFFSYNRERITGVIVIRHVPVVCGCKRFI